MRRRLPAALLGVLAMAWATGCAEPPTALVDATRAQLEAVAVEAATYAPDAYKAAQQAEAQLDAELRAQNEKFVFFRSYARATELAASVDAAVDGVQQAVTAGKERVRTETSRVVADAKLALMEANQSLEKTPEGEVSGLRTELAAAETSLGEVDSLLSAGQLIEAQRKAETALQAVRRVNEGERNLGGN